MAALLSILVNAPLEGSLILLCLLLPAGLFALALRRHRTPPYDEARHRLRRDFWGYD